MFGNRFRTSEQCLESFYDRVILNEQVFDELHQHLKKTREDIVDRTRISKSEVQIKVSAKKSQFDSISFKLESLINKRTSEENSSNKSAIDLDKVRKSLEKHREQLEQNKRQIDEQMTKIEILSKELCRIEAERKLSEEKVERLQNSIRKRSETVESMKKVDVVLGRENLRKFVKQNETETENEKSLSILRKQSETLNEQILRLENGIEQKFVDLFPLKFEIQEKTSTPNVKESLGPNLQSRLEALEAAMGVRLNLAKGQGRNSTTNTRNPSPMELSPTNSISIRETRSARCGQGIQRSASSCDSENRPGPIKRLKGASTNENLPQSNVVAIATIKTYPPVVRRPLLTSSIMTTPKQSKQTTPEKKISSPMEICSTRSSRSSTTSSTNSSYRTPVGLSPKTSQSPSVSPSNLSRNGTKKRRSLIFGEQFSEEILKTNLFWIDDRQFDDETRTEIFLLFGSMENYREEQKRFFQKRQKTNRIGPKEKIVANRTPFALSLTKTDRLELL